jgi:hypothetical protein
MVVRLSAPPGSRLIKMASSPMIGSVSRTEACAVDQGQGADAVRVSQGKA